MLRQFNSSNKLSNIDGKRRRIIISATRCKKLEVEFRIYYSVLLDVFIFFRVIYN